MCSAVHVYDDPPANLPRNDVRGGLERVGESDDGADALELSDVEVARETLPRGLTHFARRHHAVDAEQRHAAQDERCDARRKIHALRETARGDETAVLRLRARVYECVAAHRIDDGGPALLLHRLARLRELVAVDHLARAEGFEVVSFRDFAR